MSARDLKTYQDPKTIRDILLATRTVAIVGLSPNVLRPSNFVGFYLQRHGYRIVPVNPREKEILGEQSYASLREIPFAIDVVDVFRQPDALPDIANDAIASGAKVLWAQFGVIHFDAAETATRAGLHVVMDRCMKVEHARHMGRMHWLGFNTGVVTAQRLRVE
ncbi:MAG: CoA-binding protein [Acidobacteria bacterium]|nr:CoA-binding protein [Acidobacteriota bacterium]